MHDLRPLSDLRGWEVEDDIRGWNLEDRNGKNLGKIDDLIADTNTGRVEYIVVSHGGLLGVGGDKTALPLNIARVQPQQKKVLFSGEEDDLKNAPDYTHETRNFDRYSEYWSDIEHKRQAAVKYPEGLQTISEHEEHVTEGIRPESETIRGGREEQSVREVPVEETSKSGEHIKAEKHDIEEHEETATTEHVIRGGVIEIPVDIVIRPRAVGEESVREKQVATEEETDEEA